MQRENVRRDDAGGGPGTRNARLEPALDAELFGVDRSDFLLPELTHWLATARKEITEHGNDREDVARLSLPGGTGINIRGRYALVLPAGPGAARLGYGDMSGARPERGGSGRAGCEGDHRGPASRPWLWGRGRQAGTVLVRSAGPGRPER